MALQLESFHAFGALLKARGIKVELRNPQGESPLMIAAIKGYAAERGEPVPEGAGALARCVLDSLALEYARVKDELEILRGRPIRRVAIIGDEQVTQFAGLGDLADEQRHIL